jgi:hypothetical protein
MMSCYCGGRLHGTSNPHRLLARRRISGISWLSTSYNNNPSLGAVVVVVDYLNSASIWHILFFFICSQRTIMLNALCFNVMKSFYSNNIKGDRSSLVLVILRRRTRRKRRRTKRRCSFF